MKRILAALLCMLLPAVAFAADNSYKIVYDGGSIPNVKANTDMKLYIDADHIRIMKGKDEIAQPTAISTNLWNW
jgi:hypothetical protein